MEQAIICLSEIGYSKIPCFLSYEESTFKFVSSYSGHKNKKWDHERVGRYLKLY